MWLRTYVHKYVCFCNVINLHACRPEVVRDMWLLGTTGWKCPWGLMVFDLWGIDFIVVTHHTTIIVDVGFFLMLIGTT